MEPAAHSETSNVWQRSFANLLPNRDAALRQYRERAAVYDLELKFLEPIRRRAISRLWLRRGSTVIDVACGTGLSFESLCRQVGSKGRVIGVEQSAEMLERAAERVRAHGWRNVTLIHSAVEQAAIPAAADAILLHFAHDVMRTPAAIDNLVRSIRPGARVVAAGLKWAPAWKMPVNFAVFFAAMRSLTAFEGLQHPWSYLEPALADFRIDDFLGDGVYLASGIASPSKIPTA
jgi:ubiquinone/menaquinone biosynthesis C-methylase UbiE